MHKPKKHHHHKHNLKLKTCFFKRMRRGGHHGRFLGYPPCGQWIDLDIINTDDSSNRLETREPQASAGQGTTAVFFPRFLRHQCKACGKCQRVCPTMAIQKMDEKHLRIDVHLCTGCGACLEACPTGALTI